MKIDWAAFATVAISAIVALAVYDYVVSPALAGSTLAAGAAPNTTAQTVQ
jgi:hypothetical protein